MSTGLLYHAFGIRDKCTRIEHHNCKVVFTIIQEPEAFRCSVCSSRHVISRG